MVQPYVFYQSQFMPASEAQLPATSRAAAYGDGCFETLRAYQGRLLALDRHIERFRQGMDFLGINAPRECTEARFAHIIGELLERNNLSETDARIRIQVWRDGPLGYLTDNHREPILMIGAYRLGVIPPPMRLAVVDVRRIPNQCLPSAHKLSNGLNYIHAQKQASILGFDEALMCDIHGRISESSMANIFWIRDGILETPSLACDALPGITRALVMEMMDTCIPKTQPQGNTEPAVPLQFAEVEAEPGILRNAVAVFTCNSLRELHPVACVGETNYETDSVTVRNMLSCWESFRNDKLI